MSESRDVEAKFRLSGAGREPREIFSEADGPDFSKNERKFRVGYSLWEGLRARGYGAIEK